MKKVIITGADGFVGSYTTQYFLDNNYYVFGIDCKKEPVRLKSNVNLKYLYTEGSSIDCVLNALPIDNYNAFIHFAWMGSAGPDRADYNIQMKNAIMAVECVKIAKNLGCKRFVGAGSIMEKEVAQANVMLGNKPGIGYIYGIGKLTAHYLCKTISANVGIDFLWPMITNAYGVGELSPRLINTTIRKIINNEELQFTSATQNYDFIYVFDVAKAFYLLSEKGKPYYEYVIGSGDAKPLKEYLNQIIQICNPKIVSCFGSIPFQGVDLPVCEFDTYLLKKDCQFEPSVTFDNGIRRTLEWLRTI